MKKNYIKRDENFLDLVKEKLVPIPGLFSLIDLFKKNKFKFSITSSGTKGYINLILSKVELENIFDVVISGDDVKIGKPNPETYMVACKKLNLQPKECIVLEDATVGIKAAKRAGCKCIAVKNPNTPQQDFSKADYVVNSLGEISL